MATKSANASLNGTDTSTKKKVTPKDFQNLGSFVNILLKFASPANFGADKRSKYVKEKYSDARIGIRVKTKKPISHGEMKTYPAKLSLSNNLLSVGRFAVIALVFETSVVLDIILLIALYNLLVLKFRPAIELK